uniref:NADH dehydrogenase subunit 2 n=1 Tax=Jonas distinctus TaxID=1550543 RepID=UPI0023F0D236|nr:NADH dehydrogenase subunit 2 [Jonas distinctus]WDV10180.1 NADH dehydrogenase subunit 2 [Jonas distinctus]WOR86764.1 NADH dehydrogenase subunit 2 [Jonas distinctus]
MSQFSSSLLFFFTLLSGSILSISSSSWFGAWIGLELNLMSFVPLITMKLNSHLSEAALKYFLIQALSSTIIILSSSLLLTIPHLSSTLLLLALFMKLGAAPLHFWFPTIIQGLYWPQAILLMTIQKLAPMFLISYLMFNNLLIYLTFLSSILCALMGALGGLNVMKLPKIMAFSSINHMAWMMIGIALNDTSWILYFLLYSIISSSVIMMFYLFKAYSLSHLMMSNHHNPLILLSTPIALLSLGGLPPFTGFFPKLLMMQTMINNMVLVPLFFLLFSTLITLYFYTRIIISFLLLTSPSISLKTKQTSSTSLLTMSPYILFFNTLGLIITPMFLL